MSNRATTADEARIEPLARAARTDGASLLQLIALLDDPSWRVRREVIVALAGLGDIALARLCESLRDDRKSETRIAATVDTLVAAAADVERALIDLVPGARPAFAADIAQVLGRRRNPRSVPALVELLGYDDDNVAVAAIEALGRVGGRAAVDALVDAVGSDHFFRVYPSIDVLGRSGDPRAVAPLSELLRKPQYVLEAARALGRTGDKGAVRPLSELLGAQQDATVRAGALALAELLERHRDLYGSSKAVHDALRTCVSEAAVRRLSQAFLGADPDESVAMCAVLGASQSDAAAPILARLLDGAPLLAAAAAAALEQLGRDAGEPLRHGILTGNSARRQTLLPLLPKFGGAAVAAACLDDPDPTVRALACDVLARIGDSSVVSALFARLSEPNPRVVQAAVSAIQSLGSRETEPLARAATSSSEALVRRAAFRILSYFGHIASIDRFEAAIADSDSRVRDVAIAGLGLLDHPRALALLRQCADHPDERCRAAAMRGFGQTGASAEVSDALTRGLGDSDAWVRYYACQAVGKLKLSALGGDVVKLLADPAGQVRVAAVEALSHLQSAEALDALRGAATAEEPDVQRAALIGLGLIRSSEPLPEIIAACDSTEAATRLVALSALSAVMGPDTLPIAARALRDPDEGVRAVAIAVLASWPDQAATSVLVDLLRDEAYRARAAHALASPAPGRVPGLVDALARADDELAPRITSVLARVEPNDSSGALIGALQLPNVAARKAVAAVLAAQGTRAAVAALVHHATNDPSEEVRRVCALLLVQ